MDDGGATLATLQEEVAALRDLFQRRLLEDKAKQRLFDELYAQLEFGRKGLAAQSLEPLIREELMLLDRLERHTGDDHEFVESIAAELREVLARRGVEPVRVTRTFDPSCQEVVATNPAPEEHVGQVVAVRRRGYTLGGKLIRPAQVVIGAPEEEELDVEPAIAAAVYGSPEAPT